MHHGNSERDQIRLSRTPPSSTKGSDPIILRRSTLFPQRSFFPRTLTGIQHVLGEGDGVPVGPDRHTPSQKSPGSCVSSKVRPSEQDFPKENVHWRIGGSWGPGVLFFPNNSLKYQHRSPLLVVLSSDTYSRMDLIFWRDKRKDDQFYRIITWLKKGEDLTHPVNFYITKTKCKFFEW